jgi:hypothetical protein
MKEFIIKMKKWTVSPLRVEYVMHYLITAIVVSYVLNYIGLKNLETGKTVLWALAVWGGGVLLNAIPEKLLPKPNYKDVLAGSAGGTQSLIVFLITLWLTK